MKKIIIIIISILINFQILQASEEKIVVLTVGYNAIQFDAKITLAELKEKIGLDNLLMIQGAEQSTTYKKEYEDSGFGYLNSFTQTEQGKAFWFKVNQDVTFSYIIDSTFGNKNITLNEGWSFVGAIQALTLEEIKEQLGENLLVIQGAEQGSSYKKEYEDGGFGYLNTFKQFQEGKGYWVKVEQATTLSFLFDSAETVQKQAQSKIETYADNVNSPKPTLQDYLDAGVVGVTAENLEAVNRTVDNATKEEVDTVEELNDLVSNPCIALENLKVKIANDENVTEVNTGCITDMSNLFKDNKTFNQNIGLWDVSNVTTMESMFNGAENFNQDISNWDVSSVTTMYAMFVGVQNFNPDIIENWDMTNVSNQEHMFDSIITFNKYIGVWKPSYSLHSAAYKTNASAAPNSLGALKYCIEKGIIFDGDIQLSTDNVLVMSHDSAGDSKNYTTLDEILSYIKNDAPNIFIQLEAKYFDWDPSNVAQRDMVAILNKIKHYNLFDNIMLWSRSVEGALFIREYLDSIDVTNEHIGIWVYNQYTYGGDSYKRVNDLIMQVAENKYKHVDLIGLYAGHGFPDGIRELNEDIEIQMLFSDNSPPMTILNDYIEKGLTHIASDNPEEYLATGLFE